MNGRYYQNSKISWTFWFITETVQNEVKEQKGGFLSMLLGTLDVSLLGNLSTGRGTNRAGEGVIRAGYGSHSSKMDF